MLRFKEYKTVDSIITQNSYKSNHSCMEAMNLLRTYLDHSNLNIACEGFNKSNYYIK